MKIRVASASRAEFEQLGDRLLVFEIVEQLAHPLDVAQRGFVEQVGLAAHDQHRAACGILAPHRQPALDQVAAGAIELRAARGDLPAHRRAASASVRPASRAVM